MLRSVVRRLQNLRKAFRLKKAGQEPAQILTKMRQGRKKTRKSPTPATKRTQIRRKLKKNILQQASKKLFPVQR